MDNQLLDSLLHHEVSRRYKESAQEIVFPSNIQKNRIQVWSASYRDLEQHYKILSSVISSAEWRTASSLRNSKDTRKYILRHGVLRILLGNYTNNDPQKISLLVQRNGKPVLDHLGNNADISFNLSHTKEMVLIGIIRNHRIGVDIVKIDPFFQYHDIAEYILTPAEKTFMQRIRPASRYQVFFRIWAIKEAIIKATGETLAIIREIDTSEIIQDLFSYHCCSIQFSVQHPEYFVWQTFCEPDHHGVIAVEIGNSS